MPDTVFGHHKLVLLEQESFHPKRLVTAPISMVFSIMEKSPFSYRFVTKMHLYHLKHLRDHKSRLEVIYGF